MFVINIFIDTVTDNEILAQASDSVRITIGVFALLGLINRAATVVCSIILYRNFGENYRGLRRIVEGGRISKFQKARAGQVFVESSQTAAAGVGSTGQSRQDMLESGDGEGRTGAPAASSAVRVKNPLEAIAQWGSRSAASTAATDGGGGGSSTSGGGGGTALWAARASSGGHGVRRQDEAGLISHSSSSSISSSGSSMSNGGGGGGSVDGGAGTPASPPGIAPGPGYSSRRGGGEGGSHIRVATQDWPQQQQSPVAPSPTASMLSLGNGGGRIGGPIARGQRLER